MCTSHVASCHCSIARCMPHDAWQRRRRRSVLCMPPPLVPQEWKSAHALLEARLADQHAAFAHSEAVLVAQVGRCPFRPPMRLRRVLRVRVCIACRTGVTTGGCRLEANPAVRAAPTTYPGVPQRHRAGLHRLTQRTRHGPEISTGCFGLETLRGTQGSGRGTHGVLSGYPRVQAAPEYPMRSVHCTVADSGGRTPFCHLPATRPLALARRGRYRRYQAAGTAGRKGRSHCARGKPPTRP